MVNVTEHGEFNSTVESGYVSKNASYRDAFQIWNVALSRAMPRRVVLDGRKTVGFTNSKLQFYWSWSAADSSEFYNTIDAQTGFETPYSPTSALVLMDARIYYITLTVHDGCSSNSVDFALDARCGASPSRLTATQAQTLSGRNLYTWQLSFEDSSSNCANSFDWEFKNYTQSGTFEGFESGVSTLYPSYALLFLLALLFSLFH